MSETAQRSSVTRQTPDMLEVTGNTTSMETRKQLNRADGGGRSLAEVALKLFEYCRSNDWSGWDPYDGLNSRIFQALPFRRSSLARLAFIQLMKRSPINLRRLLLVPKGQNPKGIALFLSAVLKMREVGLLHDDEAARALAERLLALASREGDWFGWGYNFDWQMRVGFVSRGTPNIICTTFAGNALLDAYEVDADPRYLDAAVRGGRFLLDTLYYEPSDREGCFSYTPLGRARVHNANLLGAAFVARVGRVTSEQGLIDTALKAARFSVVRQHPSGAWDYGDCDLPPQRWIDNFHTGFNLCALRAIREHAGTDEFESAVRRGFKFYREHFFEPNGAPWYYHDRLYPIDIHSAAQSIIILAVLEDLDQGALGLAERVFCWTIKHMRSRKGFFYFQKHPWGTNRIPYMRWSQAWMLTALATLTEALAAGDRARLSEDTVATGDPLPRPISSYPVSGRQLR